MEAQFVPPGPVQPIVDSSQDVIAPEAIESAFSSDSINLISAALDSRILAFSDEFFAPASNLTSPNPPVQRPGIFVHTGAWYDGWETRRHNPAPYDWVIIRLGVVSGVVKGAEVDTAFFNGNQAPEISIDAAFETGIGGDERVCKNHFQWGELLGKRKCGPSQRQAWMINSKLGTRVTHVRLRMYPDGGIARFRLFGQAAPMWPTDLTQEIELSAAIMGGVAVQCSDQHFGRKENLILPGRGVNMGDGWETKRSRSAGHVDWAVVRLGARGKVSKVVVDTAHFRGNFPKCVTVDGIDLGAGEGLPGTEDGRWVRVLEMQQMKADEEHEFGKDWLKAVEGCLFTHMRLTIIPDGGVKRFRVFGTKA